MGFVIVTGMSGAGKSRAMNAFEDLGYFCVDNLPPALLPKFSELCDRREETITNIAVSVDIRGRSLFNSFADVIEEFRAAQIKFSVLFIDANDKELFRRYKETRRKHPLIDECEGDLEKAIETERGILGSAITNADFVIDTSYLSPIQERERIVELFSENKSQDMRITCMSFGFKYGIPKEADIVFDVRCLPNPFYIDDMKYKTGCDSDVIEYVMKFDESINFLSHITGLLDFSMPLYKKEGKSQMVIAVGCTGGRHRSVVFAEKINEHLCVRGYNSFSVHRDYKK